MISSSELAPLQKDADNLLAKAYEVSTIVTVEQEARAVEFLAQTKRRMKIVEEKRKQYVDPLNASLKLINADFKAISEPLSKAEEVVKHGMSNFRDSESFRLREQERKEAELLAQRAVMTAVETGLRKDEKAADKAVTALNEAKEEAPRKVETQSGQARYRKDWKFEVTEPEKVMREFCSPDLVKIRALIKAGLRSMDGVRIWEETVPIILS